MSKCAEDHFTFNQIYRGGIIDLEDQLQWYSSRTCPVNNNSCIRPFDLISFQNRSNFDHKVAVNAPEVFCIISWLAAHCCSFKSAWCSWIVCVCCAFLCIKRHLYSVLLCSDVASMVLYGILIRTWKWFYCFNKLCVAFLSLSWLKSCCIYFYFWKRTL